MLLLYPVNEIIQLVSSLFTFHYASTLSQTSATEEGSTPHLHSTMLLLYPKLFPAIPEYSVIYIPLCFYFIYHPAGLLFHLSDLHSTMLLLYPGSCYHRLPHLVHLHSTMLLLYRGPAGPRSPVSP